MIRKQVLAALLLAFAASPATAARLLTLDDMFQERDVGDPQISPDGAWVAYTVEAMDAKSDDEITHIWMTSWDGTRTIQLTGRARESETAPRFSPDGRYIAFLSGRGADNEIDQVWLMERAGGEAQRISDFKGEVTDIAWSPDGKRLALIVEDSKPDDKAKDDDKDKKPAPIVIDRYYFKEDVTGYQGKQRQHLYVFDLATHKAERVAPGDYNEYLPAWSPDGKSLAFVSMRRPDFDRTNNFDLYVVDAHAGATPRALTTFPGPDDEPDWLSYPAWSPDGKSIAYMQGGPLKLIEYAVRHLAVVPAAGGTPRLLSAGLDRNVMNPVWSADGKSIRFLVEDDRAQYLARVPAEGGPIAHIAGGRNVIAAHAAGRADREALLIGTPGAPAEVFAFDGRSAPRQLSHQNDWLKGVTLGATQETAFRSADGTEVHGYVVTPPGYRAGGKIPAILSIHGGRSGSGT